jgi:hypothetical protein
VSRFSEVFFIDATTTDTIADGLKSIVVSKRLGASQVDALDWLSGHCEEWLLLFDNADDTKINFRKYFPHCSHGNILITTRNRECMLYALQSSIKISSMEPADASDLLLKMVCLTDQLTDENSALAAVVAKVGFYSSWIKLAY